MNETALETIAAAAKVLKLDFSSEEVATYVDDEGLSQEMPGFCSPTSVRRNSRPQSRPC